MRIGFLKTGNDYNFKPENVKLFRGETRDDIKNLNKVELRYNTRVGQPSYPAMKSLYKWRSVFGYRLGGAIRQAIVKFSDIIRHAANAYNLHQALAEARQQKKEDRAGVKPELKDVSGSEGKVEIKAKNLIESDIDLKNLGVKEYEETFSSLDKYVRKYSSRDVCNALKKLHPEGISTLKYLKYHKFDEIHESGHKTAASLDFSVRKLIVDARIDRHKTKEDWNSVRSIHQESKNQIAERNIENEKKFEELKKNDFKKMREEIEKLEEVELPQVELRQRPEKKEPLQLGNDPKLQNETEEKPVPVDTSFLEDGKQDGEHMNPNSDMPKPTTQEVPKKLAKDMTREQLIQNYAYLREIDQRKFVPEKIATSDEVFDKAEATQKQEDRFGNISRFVHGNLPINDVKQGITHAGKFISFKLGFKARHENAKQEQKIYLEAEKEYNKMFRPEGIEKFTRKLNNGGATYLKAFFETRVWHGHNSNIQKERTKEFIQNYRDKEVEKLGLNKPFVNRSEIDNEIFLNKESFSDDYKWDNNLKDALKGVEFGRLGERGEKVGTEFALKDSNGENPYKPEDVKVSRIKTMPNHDRTIAEDDFSEGEIDIDDFVDDKFETFESHENDQQVHQKSEQNISDNHGSEEKKPQKDNTDPYNPENYEIVPIIMPGTNN